ncbi:MAG TPA: ribosome biogenesis GTPase Der, partial [Pseudoduganella sp.]
NVGKSTLVNRFLGRRAAVVQDIPGVTRDRISYDALWNGKRFTLVDTGGWDPKASGLGASITRQAQFAMETADVIVLVVDSSVGATDTDLAAARILRRSDRPVILVANKVDDERSEAGAAELWSLGLGEPQAVSALHGRSSGDLLDLILDAMPEAPREQLEEGGPRRVALVGRPNVGKSTLVNALLGEERVIVFDQPGTTRDSIYIDFEHGGRPFTLIDTAGVRKRGKISEAAEKFSVVKTMQSISDANVIVLLLDAQQDISEQDAHIAGFILESGRALVLAVNKWDGLQTHQRDQVKNDMDRKLDFLGFAKTHFISALKGTGIGPLMKAVDAAYGAAMANLSTPKLTRALAEAIEKQEPKRKGGLRPKMRYAHQGGMNPPVIVIHGNSLDAISDPYKRYLEKHFRDTFQLVGTPLRIELRTGKNPFDKRDKG